MIHTCACVRDHTVIISQTLDYVISKLFGFRNKIPHREQPRVCTTNRITTTYSRESYLTIQVCDLRGVLLNHYTVESASPMCSYTAAVNSEVYFEYGGCKVQLQRPLPV